MVDDKTDATTIRWHEKNIGKMDYIISAPRPRLVIERIGDVPLPSYATDGSNGLDLTFRHFEGKVSNIKFFTGLKVQIPQGYVGLLLPRSSYGLKYGMRLHNTCGVIDSDFRGEIIVSAHFETPATLNPGDRIAQLVIVPAPQFEIVEGLVNETARGEGGFGSTGV